MDIIFLTHLGSCLAMTGIIWLVQILIYPLLGQISEQQFIQIHNFQMKRITMLVAPLMLIEIFTASLLLYQIKTQTYLFNLISVLMLWSYTFLVNVPAHKQLSYNNQKSKNYLILKNWPRTILWSLRSMLLLFLTLKSMVKL